MKNPGFPAIRVIPYRKKSAHFNMAADDFALLLLEDPILRFYGWKKPTLSFGKSKPNLDPIDRNVCKQFDIAGVKRTTGGKTVLHHLELTYSFVVDAELFPRKILDSYLVIGKALARGFKSLGLQVEMREEKNTDLTTICFKEVSSYEITVGGKKLVGSAQRRSKKRILQHGSILMDADWVLWAKIWKASESEELKMRVTTLKEEMDSVPSFEALQSAFADGFAKEMDTTIRLRDYFEDEIQAIDEISERFLWPEFYEFQKKITS